MTDKTMGKAEQERGGWGPVVASKHLAGGALPALSELEFALMMSGHAFDRWIVKCMAAAGYPDLSALDVMVVHTVYSRNKAKSLADLCLILNIEDTHTIAYSTKKLERVGLIVSGKRGKEKVVEISAEGARACENYARLRESLLVEALAATGVNAEKMQDLAALLRIVSGHYDQAARSAAAF